jgi:hypothetical protein
MIAHGIREIRRFFSFPLIKFPHIDTIVKDFSRELSPCQMMQNQTFFARIHHIAFGKQSVFCHEFLFVSQFL